MTKRAPTPFVISTPFDNKKITMPNDSLTCPDCGRLVEFDVDSEAMCECGKSLRRIVPSEKSQTSGVEVFLLACPKCGSQRQARGEWIGKTDVCECGQKYRFTLVLAKVPAEPDGVIAQGIRHAQRYWNVTLDFSQREIVPRLKQAWVYTCAQIVPCIVSSLTAAYAWTVKAFRSAFNPGPPPRPDFRKTYNEPVNSDWVEVPVSPDRTKVTLSAVTSPMPLVEPLNNSPSPMPMADSATSEDSATESSNPQWKKYHQLALQSLNAGVYQDAYTYAAKAIELEPNDAFAWCTKGLATAYVSLPPDFRLNEVRLCINEAIKSSEVRQIIPSLQEHIFTAVRGYRELVDKAYAKARDDAQKEPLTNEVNIGLQLTLRNKRVERVSNELHEKGYMSSVDAIMFARDLAPTLVASKKALVELDKVLGRSLVSSFKESGSNTTARDRVVGTRGRLIAEIYRLDPTFESPQLPESPGCFIATAAAGDANHSAVIQLRGFRDVVLLKYSTGGQLVHWYYRLSPSASRLIEQSAFLRCVVFFVLVVPAAFVASFVSKFFRD
ncbi:MAG: CFI-box-CTERM domain-containing protein [Planctomycetaceae bacterium]